jgi:hypothetical protein
MGRMDGLSGASCHGVSQCQDRDLLRGCWAGDRARDDGCRRLFSTEKFSPLEVTAYVVPAEGIEPPTFGLQNRCSTAELSRRI